MLYKKHEFRIYLLPIVAYTHTLFGDQSLQSEVTHGNRILISCTRSFFQAFRWDGIEFRIGALRKNLVTMSWQFWWQHRIFLSLGIKLGIVESPEDRKNIQLCESSTSPMFRPWSSAVSWWIRFSEYLRSMRQFEIYGGELCGVYCIIHSNAEKYFALERNKQLPSITSDWKLQSSKWIT